MLFGIAVLVLSQAYIEDVVEGRLPIGYLDFWARLFTIDRGLCLSGSCPSIPINHLWFIDYIWAYSLVVAALMLRPSVLQWMEQALRKVRRGGGALLVPLACLAVARVVLFPALGVTNHLFDDWNNHAMSVAAFLFGFLMATQALLG